MKSTVYPPRSPLSGRKSLNSKPLISLAAGNIAGSRERFSAPPPMRAGAQRAHACAQAWFNLPILPKLPSLSNTAVKPGFFGGDVFKPSSFRLPNALPAAVVENFHD